MGFLAIGIAISGSMATWINPADSNVKITQNPTREKPPKGTAIIDDNYFCKICDVQV